MREVVILGFAADPATRPVFDGAFGDAEIWTVNDWWNFYPRLTRPHRIYQMHDDAETLIKVGNRDVSGWKKRYNDSGAAIVSVVPFEGVENLRRFDIEEARRRFPARCFSSSIAYLLMDAIMERVDSMRLCGVELKLAGEYEYQRPAICELVDIASSSGMIVNAPLVGEWRKSVNWSEISAVDMEYGRKPCDAIRLKVQV